jgi:KUP system potassium uptake protein
LFSGPRALPRSPRSAFDDMPRVPSPDRFKMVQVLDSFWHVTVRYGFIEVPDLPVASRGAKETRLPCRDQNDQAE